MFAMALESAGGPLVPREYDEPEPGPGELVLDVEACGICRTDLHLIDDELPDITHPIIPGHQVVGRVSSTGRGVDFRDGQRVGATWLAWTCGSCAFCKQGQENLCRRARFNGYQVNGGYASRMKARESFCLPLPDDAAPHELAPLLCAGLIGYRSYRLAGEIHRLGIYGFGSAAHVITQLAVQQGREIYAFTRPGDEAAQKLARELGAVWAGDSEQQAPMELDAALIFAPVGSLVPTALRNVRPGGSVICGGIHMSDIPAFPYADLWDERRIQSVANLTRQDGHDFMAAIATHPVRPRVTTYALTDANQALDELRTGRISGSGVLMVDDPGV